MALIRKYDPDEAARAASEARKAAEEVAKAQATVNGALEMCRFVPALEAMSVHVPECLVACSASCAACLSGNMHMYHLAGEGMMCAYAAIAKAPLSLQQ